MKTGGRVGIKSGGVGKTAAALLRLIVGALLFCMCAAILCCGFFSGGVKADSVLKQDNGAAPNESAAGSSLKVGWLTDENTCFYDKQTGKFYGYVYDVLFEISQYSDFGLEFVLPESKNAAAAKDELREKLMRGEIDLLCNAYPDGGDGLFYTSGYAVSYDVIALPSGSTLTAADLKNLNLTIAVKAGDEEKLRAVESQLGGCSVLSVVSRGEQYAALNKPTGDSGHADAVLITDMETPVGVKPALKFSPRALCFVSSDGKTAERADKALDKAFAARTDFLDGLKEKYFSAQNQGRLSAEEKEYIASRGALRVVMPDGKAPVSYYSQSGEPVGIAKDVMNYVAAKTGISVSYVQSGDYAADLIENRADIIAAVPRVRDSVESYNVNLSGEYLTAGLAVLANKKVNAQKLEGKRLVLAKDMPVSAAAENCTFAETLSDCLKLVNEGKADYTYGNAFCISYALAEKQYSNLKYIGLTEYTQSIAIGVSKREDALLLSAIDKALSSMSDAEKNAIIFANSLVEREEKFDFFFSPLFALAVAILAAGALFFVIELFIVKLRRRDAVIENRWEKLCELDNQYLYYYDFKKDELSLSPSLAAGFSRQHYFKRFSNYAESQKDADFKRIVKSFRQGGGGVAEMKIKGEDNSTRYLLISEKEIEDEKGRAVGAIGKIEDITDEKAYKLNADLGRERDSLTDLYNSAAMKEKVESAIKEGADGAVFMLLDIDNFARINESGGNLEGDKVLISAARILENTLKDEDALIGRLGGDEFMIYIAGGINRRRLTEIVSALRYNIRSIAVSVKGMSVTLSLGCVVPRNGQSFGELYDRADKALHEAKAAGRNTYEIARGIDEQ